MEGKKREWKDCGRFSGSEKPHLVLRNVQDCCRCFSPWLPCGGSLQDLSPSVDASGGTIQTWSRCAEWQETGITISLALLAALGMSSHPWDHPSRAVPNPSCPRAGAECVPGAGLCFWSWFGAICKLDEMQSISFSRPSVKPLHRKQKCIKELVLYLRHPVFLLTSFY